MKKIRYISIYFCLFLCLLFIFINRKPLITDQDRIYIDKFLAEWKINLSAEQVHADFNSESAFIQKLVTSVVSTINHKEIQNSNFGNIKYYYENRLGFCYDRAILMEKIFRYYHFNFRHVFVYYLKDPNAKPGVLDFFRKSTLSHAITEVETKKGWMVIDSNTDCVGIDKNGNVLNTNDLKEKA
ncbi:MAG: transglutaminase domain-containing protein, partial [Flavisolibacter sp.]